MNNTFGRYLTVTLFGESHGPAVGAVIDGMPAGVRIDEEYIQRQMAKRRSFSAVSTPRAEADVPEFLSGVKDGFTEGTPVALIIRNNNVRRSDYAASAGIPRPGHADYTGRMKYLGYEDQSGGGHFSGRLTAPLTAAGAVILHMLEEKGILIGSHILEAAGIRDTAFSEENMTEEIGKVNDMLFAVLDEEAQEKMLEAIQNAAADNDSVGGILETAVTGLPAGLGEPFFDSAESLIAHGMFSIPAVKGISFGTGFGLASMRGSEANDPFVIRNGRVETETNNNGGINGGITNGMPVLFQTVIKPTPSIAKAQRSVNLETMQETDLVIHGRHDPAVIHRARVVADSMTAFVIADLLLQRYGELWFTEKKK